MRQINIDKKGWFKKATPFFILFILTAIFLSETLFGNKIFIHRDLGRFFYPLREFSAKEFLEFRIPLLNPYIHCGAPHLAELQTCVFYPLSIVYLIFPYPSAFNYFIAMHIFLAGLFMYILMRGWGYSEYAAFISAVIFMFSGYIISVINLLASLASVIWVPLVILFYERSLRNEWVKNSMITGVFLTFMFLGGEPVILYATLFILILFAYAVEQVSPRRWIGCLLLAILVFIGLSCFQLLPFLEFVSHSSRNTMVFNETATWSLPPYAILDLIVPYISESDYMYKDYWSRQSWLLTYYMGIAAVIFALISLKFDTARRRRVIFYILALGLVLSFGRYTALYYVLYNAMPGFRLSRYPVKFFFMAAFSLAILAGMGLDYYNRNIKANAELRGFLKVVLVSGFILSFFYLMLSINFSRVIDLLQVFISKALPDFLAKKSEMGQFLYAGIFNIKRAMFFFMVLTVCMFFGLEKKIRPATLFPIFITITLLDLFTANMNLYQNMDLKEYLKPADNVRFLNKDKSIFRIFNSPSTLRRNMFVPERDYFEGMQGLKERLVSNTGIIYGIQDAYGYGSLYNKRHEKVVDLIIRSTRPDETNLLNLLNVKYVISPKDFDIDGYRLVNRSVKVNIYENTNFLPRAFLADEAVFIKEENRLLERLKSKEFDPEKEVILEEACRAAAEGPQAKASLHQERADILRYQSNEVIIRAETKSPKFLVLSDTYYPGWRVYVDGVRDKIYRADYILRAVYLMPGEHIIRFIYRPFSFIIGVVISLGTVLVIVVLNSRTIQSDKVTK